MSLPVAGTKREGPLGKLVGLGPSGWRGLVEAQWAIARWTLVKRLRPRSRLVGREPEREPLRAGPAPAHATEMDEAERAALAVSRAARFGFLRPHCLVRSLALRDLLVRRGVRAVQVRFGVRRNPEGFQAHAWVEVHGRVIGDDPAFVETFTAVPELSFLETGE